MFLLVSRRLLYWFLAVSIPDFLERVSLSKRSTGVERVSFPRGSMPDRTNFRKV
jgi:hypothetical protein